MKTIILGGKGFIGSRLARRFASLPGWSVDALGSAECDLTAPETAALLRRRVDGDTSILFCSTISRLRDDSVCALMQNVRMAQTVVEALAGRPFRSLVFCSSIDVYGRPPRMLPLCEESPVAPTDYYGHAKFMSEFLLHRELAADGPVAILRLPGVYSLDEGDPSVLGSLYARLRLGLPVTLSGGGTQVRTYLNISELGDVVQDVFTRRWAGLVNLGSSLSQSIAESVQLMKQHLGSDSPILEAPANGTEFDLVISNDGVRREFSAIAPKPLPEYLRRLR